MPRPVCWSKARGTRRELRPIPMGEAEIDSLLFRQKRYLTCLLSSFYAKNAKKKEVEVPQWTVGSEQWSVRPAPPVIFIVRREGLIICKAGLRSPAVWGLVSKASSTTSRKLLRIIHVPKPVYCSKSRHGTPGARRWPHVSMSAIYDNPCKPSSFEKVVDCRFGHGWDGHGRRVLPDRDRSCICVPRSAGSAALVLSAWWANQPFIYAPASFSIWRRCRAYDPLVAGAAER